MKGFKRKNYLINPNFQIRMSLYIVVCILICTIVYPVGMWQLFFYFGETLSRFDPNLLPAIMEQKSEVFMLLLFWELGIISIVFIMCIFISHKIAGPLHKLKDYLRELPNQKIVPKLLFRKGDYFSEIADLWNDSFSKIQGLNISTEVKGEICRELEEIKNTSSVENSLKIQSIIDKINLVK